MSSLTLLPSGETFDYWWERLRGQNYRRRFLLTKAVEVLAYKGAKKHRQNGSQKLHKPVLEMEPRIELNQIHCGGISATVVPARCTKEKDGRMLRHCVDALLEQDSEVILVDDGSLTWPDVPSCVHVLRHPSSFGPAKARNTGTYRALQLGASLILFTDADCIPNKEWVSAAKAGFMENSYIHVQSGNTVSAGSTWFDTYHNINGTLNGRRFKGSDTLLYGPTCNLAISRVLAESIAFDASFPNAACEDIDYCLRILDAGYRIVHNRKMHVEHDFQYRKSHPLANIALFIKQFRKYASAEAQLLEKSPVYYGLFAQSIEIPALTIMSGGKDLGCSSRQVPLCQFTNEENRAEQGASLNGASAP